MSFPLVPGDSAASAVYCSTSGTGTVMGVSPARKTSASRVEDCLRAIGFFSPCANDVELVNFVKNEVTLQILGKREVKPLPNGYQRELADSLFDYLTEQNRPVAAEMVRTNYHRAKMPPAISKEPTLSTTVTASAPAAQRTIKQRITGAMKEGIKRAPVEIALEEGQKLLVRQLLRGFKGSRSEREGARKFLLWFFSSPAGQVAIAGAIAGGAPLVAGLIGKDGAVVQIVADEFAARAATITTKEGIKFAAAHLKSVLGLFGKLFDAFGGDAAAAGALPDAQPCAAVFDLDAERARTAAVPR